MTFTYNLSLTDPISKVRQRIGDTNSAKPLFQDETITAVYQQVAMNELRAAAQLAFDLAARFAQMTEVTVDHQTSRGDVLAKHYTDLGNRLLADAAGQRAPPASTVYAGVLNTYVADQTGPYALDPCNPYEPPWWAR